jgi:hypothetical protein
MARVGAGAFILATGNGTGITASSDATLISSIRTTFRPVALATASARANAVFVASTANSLRAVSISFSAGVLRSPRIPKNKFGTLRSQNLE